MPRPTNLIPSYRHHRQSGQAIVTVRQSDGRRKDILLGPWNSGESRQEYARIVAEINTTPAIVVGNTLRLPTQPVSVNEVLVEFISYADIHYRRIDGSPTSEPAEYRRISRLLRSLYGHTRAAEFGPLALSAIQQQMIKLGWSRKVINQRIGRIKRIFKWAVSKQLVPANVYHGLVTLSGLQRGRSEAKEREPIKPIALETVNATLPYLTRHVAGLVRFQMLTGCRPGEACSIRRSDIEMSGPVWKYRPSQHKLAYRGQERVIALGPLTQALLEEFPTNDPNEFVFSPALAIVEIRLLRASRRKTPKWPSHIKRNELKRKNAPRRAPAHRYLVESYARAVAGGVKKANNSKIDSTIGTPMLPLTHWHPNQLRHSHATKVRALFGLEAAQVALGHARADVTQIYAEKNLFLAENVALALG